MKKKKFKLSATGIFAAVVALLILVAVAYDFSRRASWSSTRDLAQAPRGLEDLDLEQLQVRFDATEVATSAIRPSTLQAIDRRCEIARAMIVRSADDPAELANSRNLLIRSLANSYSTRRNAKWDYQVAKTELVELLNQIIESETGESRRFAALVQCDLLAHEILDGNETPESMERLKKWLGLIRKEYSDMETMKTLSATLLELTLARKESVQIPELLEFTSGLFADHPDANIVEWSKKLHDDQLLRRHGVFMVHYRLLNKFPGAAASFRETLPKVLEEPLTVIGLARLVGFCRDLEGADEYGEAETCYRLLLAKLEPFPESPVKSVALLDCKDGLTRILGVGKPVEASFLDVKGNSITIQDPANHGQAFVVVVFSESDDFETFYQQNLSAGILKSRNIGLIACFRGLKASQVLEKHSRFADEGVVLVSAEEGGEALQAICPVRETPFVWIISRTHLLQDVNVLVEQIAQECEALMGTN